MSPQEIAIEANMKGKISAAWEDDDSRLDAPFRDKSILAQQQSKGCRNIRILALSMYRFHFLSENRIKFSDENFGKEAINVELNCL